MYYQVQLYLQSNFILAFIRSFVYECLIFTLQRPESVKIDARDVTGVRFSFSLSELPARVFQHEFDHLQVFLSLLPL